MSLMPHVNAALTYIVLRPVSGCVRTTGCSEVGYLRAHLLLHLGRLAVPEGAGEIVQCDQTVDLGLGRLVEQVVGRGHVGPQRVAADRRKLDRPQDRAHRRLGTPRHVAVPHLRGLVLAPGRKDEDLGLLLVLGSQRMDLEIPERATEGDVTLPVEAPLVSEEHDLPLEERGADRGNRVGGQVLGEVDPADLGPDRRRHRCDRQGHVPIVTVRAATVPGGRVLEYVPDMSTITVVRNPVLATATITLDRPDRKNALSVELRDEFGEALADLSADDAIKSVVVTGSGDVFSAGFDLGEFAARSTIPGSERSSGPAATGSTTV